MAKQGIAYKGRGVQEQLQQWPSTIDRSVLRRSRCAAC